MKELKKAGDKVTIEDVYESCRRYITNEDDMKLIKKAYDYIMVKHEGQKRKKSVKCSVGRHDAVELGGMWKRK